LDAQSARILVVDDHAIVRDGLCALLERDKRFIVIGTATDGREAIIAAMSLRPDVVVMDLVLPELSGVDATARILQRARSCGPDPVRDAARLRIRLKKSSKVPRLPPMPTRIVRNSGQTARSKALQIVPFVEFTVRRYFRCETH
jgi:CheY-like chemotaxis protein